jgi:hypothetical protein
MKSEKIVLTLGYIFIALISTYLFFGLLKIGGEGLSNLASSTIVEGMTEKSEKKISDKIKKNIEKLEKSAEAREEEEEALDNIEDMQEYKTYLGLIADELEYQKRTAIKSLVFGGPNEISKAINIGTYDTSINTLRSMSGKAKSSW